VLDEAIAHRPCLVLFDRCNGWFDTDHNYCAGGLEWTNSYLCAIDQGKARQRVDSMRSGLMGEVITTDSSYMMLPQLWTVFSHSSSSPVSQLFLEQFIAGACLVPAPTPIEVHSFVALYIKQQLVLSRLVRNEAEVPNAIGQLSELIDGYAQLFTGDVPGFMIHVIEQCLNDLHARAASASAAAAASNDLLAKFPSVDEVRIRKQQISNAAITRAARAGHGNQNMPLPPPSELQRYHHQQQPQQPPIRGGATHAQHYARQRNAPFSIAAAAVQLHRQQQAEEQRFFARGAQDDDA
jgi:hypothetical protein